jgi:hypothetical protein
MNDRDPMGTIFPVFWVKMLKPLALSPYIVVQEKKNMDSGKKESEHIAL